MSTLKSTILSVTRRTKKGFTVGEIWERIIAASTKRGTNPPPYSSVRARVYELEASGQLLNNAVRRDSTTGRESLTFIRSNQ